MYKPFQEYLEQELQRFELQSLPIPEGLEWNTSERSKNKAEIQSWCYRSERLRKIRYTYIDVGTSAQVLNCVAYPEHQYDLPILGIDLLSFGKKILVVIDFQPLFREPEYKAKYVAPMRALRDKYDDLAQDLGMRFYDANQYFSENLLFAKTDRETVDLRVMPAFKDYLQLYWELLDAAIPDKDPQAIQRIVAAQKDYDQYSAERDPAHGLFSSYFGPEWAERFLYEFLFEDAVPVAAGVARR
ncbi:MAG: 15,16-dihydrobiliverdin:ferredoxin oxidoreductase [Cyanobacteria bacterium J06641_5]